MIITIVRPNLVMVDGVSFHVSLDGLDSRVEVLQFDTQKGVGEMHFSEGVMTSVAERDFEAEYKALSACIAANKDPNKLEPIYKQKEIPRPPERITSFNHTVFYDRWLAAKNDAEAAKAKRERMAALQNPASRKE